MRDQEALFDSPTGYAALAREPPTAGFLSVVGLAPDGKDILRCKHIQDILAELKKANIKSGDQPIADFCPKETTGADDEQSQPLVFYGSGFDIGAIGIGIGAAEYGDSPELMWGSSFAAPYVTALATQIAAQGRHQRLLYNRVAANLIADRIRFTSDRLDDEGVVRYGRINAARALAFKDDLVELSELPSGQSDWSPDQIWADQCVRNGGHLRLDRQKQDIWFPASTPSGGSAHLADVQRLRRDKEGKFEALVRQKPTDMLKVSEIDARDFELPVICVGSNPANALPSKILMKHIDNYTRCSFVRDCE